MAPKSSRDRRASTPVPVGNATLPPLRIPKTLPEDKEARKVRLEEFLEKLIIRKTSKHFYALHQWWHSPLPKSTHPSKGSKVTFTVLRSVMESQLDDDDKQRMIDLGYASERREKIPGKAYLGRIIFLPNVLKYLVLEKGYELPQILSYVPMWKTRYAKFVSTGRCDGNTGSDLRQIQGSAEPCFTVGDTDNRNGDADREILLGVNDAEEDNEVFTRESTPPRSQNVQKPEQNNEIIHVQGTAPVSEDLALNAPLNSASVNHRRRDVNRDIDLTLAARAAVEGSKRPSAIRISLDDDVQRTPESVKRATVSALAGTRLYDAIRRRCASADLSVSDTILSRLSACLTDICCGDTGNFKYIYEAWGDSRADRHSRLRKVLERDGFGQEVDLLVAVVDLWMNSNDCSNQGSSSQAIAKSDARALPAPQSRKRKFLSTKRLDLLKRESGGKDTAELERDAEQSSNASDDGERETQPDKKKRTKNQNTFKSFLLVLFYTQNLGLASNMQDEIACGIDRSLCSSHSLSELCGTNKLPLSRALAYKYRKAGELILKKGKAKDIWKLREKELLRLLLSTQTCDEVIKQKSLGSDNRDGYIPDKVLAILDLNPSEVLS